MTLPNRWPHYYLNRSNIPEFLAREVQDINLLAFSFRLPEAALGFFDSLAPGPPIVTLGAARNALYPGLVDSFVPTH